MVSKKAIIGIVVVIVVIVVAALALSGGASQADGRYDYQVELADSIPGDTIDRPDEGMQFALIDFVIVNDSWSSGIETPWTYCTFSITYDGITYTDNGWLTVSHPDYQNVTINEGSSATSGAVIEIPDTATLDDITVSFEYSMTFGPTLEHDDSLL